MDAGRQTLGGKYTLVSILGEGAFSRVYRGTALPSGTPVAIKVFFPPRSQHSGLHISPEEARLRFWREARLLSQLKSPYTVRLLDFGDTSSGYRYLVFELVEGEPLASLIDPLAPTPPHEVERYLRQILISLKEAHSHRILHRDIKPENILRQSTGQIKLLDFGVAKQLGDNDGELTKAGMVIGTPRYMAPEQLLSRDLTPATDLYALGHVCYELLCGRHAILAAYDADIVGSIISPVSSVLPHNVDVPESLRNAVNGMLNKDVAARPKNVDAVLAILDGAFARPDVATAAGHKIQPKTRPRNPMFLRQALSGSPVSHASEPGELSTAEFPRVRVAEDDEPIEDLASYEELDGDSDDTTPTHRGPHHL